MSAAGGRIAAGVGFNQIGQHAQERNQEATVYIGNLDAQVTEELVWELMVQAGPVVNVYMPKDRVTGAHQNYGFVEFRGEEDAEYACKIMNMIKLFGKPVRVNKSAADRKTLDVGANLFIGNLDPELDEKLLYDTFSAFGVIVNTPKVMRDPETGNSKGFGFVSYDSFEASDAAIEAMNGQYLCNRPISVMYAYKKDTRGERHGTPAERLLAAQQSAERKGVSRPHTLFAAGPAGAPMGVGMGMAPPGLPPPPMFGGMPPPGMPPPPFQGPPGMPPPPMPPPGHMPPPGMPPPPPGFIGGPPPGYFGGPPGMPPPPFMGGPPGMPPPPFMGAPPGMPMPPPGQFRPPPGMPPPPAPPR